MEDPNCRRVILDL